MGVLSQDFRGEIFLADVGLYLMFRGVYIGFRSLGILLSVYVCVQLEGGPNPQTLKNSNHTCRYLKTRPRVQESFSRSRASFGIYSIGFRVQGLMGPYTIEKGDSAYI